MCLYLHQFIQHHSIKPRQVLDIVSLHHRSVLSDMSSELLHVEDQLCYVSAKHKNTRTKTSDRNLKRHRETTLENKIEIKQHRLATDVNVHYWCRIFLQVYVCILVYEVICVFLLNVVCVAK